jgi:hypothetical protein
VNSIRVEVDDKPGLEMLIEYGIVAEIYTKRAALETANRVVLEARSREQRQQAAGYATGKTLGGILVEDMRVGVGYVVVARRRPLGMLPKWIEEGTEQGKPGSHTQQAHPFIDPAAKLEESAHRQRMTDALQRAAKETGLGGGE